MSNDRGVFTLGAYRRAQVEGQGVDLDDVWTTDLLDDAGYFAGGESGVPDVSRIDKIAYSTDTKSTLTSNISAPLRHMGSSSSPSAGYTIGGYNSSTTSRTSKIDKLTYATQTTSLVPGNFSDTSTYAGAGGGSTTAGYLLQGSSPMVSYVRKITYATETIELLPGRVPNPVGNNAKMGSTGNGNTFLYVIGGSDGSGSEAKKLTYASDSVSNIPNMPTPGSLNRAQKPGCASSTEAAYIVGGSNPYNNRIDKITFSNDTCSYASMNSTVPVPAGRMQVAGTGLPSAGYFAGGTETSIVEKITYSTNSIARIPALDLTSGVSGATGFGAKGDNHESPVATRWRDGFVEDDLKAGYYSGGSSNGYSTVTQKVDYTTDQTSLVPGGNLPESGGQFAGANSNSIKTIMTGGEPSGNPFMQFVYATETASNLTGSMPSRRIRNNDMGYGTETAGYVTGGEKEPSSPAAYYSSTQKIEFATDTTSEAPSANSNWTMRYAGAFGNVDHTLGYVVGGQTFPGGPSISRIQKMTYSTETMANTSINMQNGYFNLGTTSGPDAGYIYSKQEYPGYTANGAIEKFVYATDSRTTVPQPSYYPSYGANGTGNSTNGYYGGGGPNRYTRILKLNFSTGVGQDLPSSQFPYNEGVYRSAAGSAVSRKKSPKGAPVPTLTPRTYLDYGSTISDNGYLGGGYTPGNSGAPVAYKVNMTTETISTPGGIPAYYQTVNGKAISSPANAYFAGGPAPTGPAGGRGVNTVKKISYATDSQSAAPSMSKGVQQSSAFGTNTAGYIVGGINTDYTPYDWTSFMQKITYSTESWSTSVYPAGGMGQQAGWHLPRPRIATGGNTTHGYMGPSSGGYSAYKSNIVRYSYATDVSETLPGYDQDGGWESGHRQTGLNSLTDWYIAGGELSPVGQVSSVAKMSFATDTVTNNVLNMNSVSGEFLSGLDNPEKGFGLIHKMSLANKITFSTDTSSNAGYSVPNNASPSGTYAQGGTSQKDFGQNVAYSNFILP